jgi:hypothetical protein
MVIGKKTFMTIDLESIYNQHIKRYSFYTSKLPFDIQHYKQHIVNILSKIYPQYGITLNINPGWIPLIVDLHKQISSLVPDYRIYQIKEKFGSLRYYADFTTSIENIKNFEYLSELIQTAELKSQTICDICTQPATLRNHSFIYKTRCDSCENS